MLVRVEDGAYANLVLPAALGRSRLSARDRAFATELVYGVCRMRRACDWLIDAHLRGPVEEEVRALLRLGAYQLAFLGTPAHAAVSATVEETPARARGLVNAVLRRVAGALPPSWPDLATELSYPDWVVAELEADLGPVPARAALAEMNRPAGATPRADGYVQDLGSQWVAGLVEAQPGQRVADLCAAPGGKATALATSAALVVAGDVRPNRARLVTANAGRLGLAGVVSTLVADGRRPPLRRGSMDRVLVDAPCSGLGVLRRRPDARWRVQPGDVGRLADLQRQLLDAATGLLAPGAKLVYSVCTMTRVETLDVDDWLATKHPELVPMAPPGEPWAPWGRGALLLPQAAGTDAMFLLRLVRAPG